MKKRNITLLAITAALALSMCACSGAAQTQSRLSSDVISTGDAENVFAAHFRETDDGLRYFVSMNGLVWSETEFKRIVENTALDPDTIKTLDLNVADEYRAAPDADNAQRPADNDAFYHSKAGAEITYGQYKKLLGAFRPTEINALDSSLINELCSQELPQAVLETESQNAARNVLDLGSKRVVFISSVKTYDETSGGKLFVSLEAGGKTKAVAFCEITKGNSRETKLFDESDSELKAKGNKLTLELDEGKFDLADFGIIAICDK